MAGQLKPRDTDVYTFNASARQIAKLTSTGQVSLQLLTPQGKPSAARSVNLPTNGTYTVKVVNQQTSSNAYTLKLEIKQVRKLKS